jgi:hypothetical protein
LGEHAPGRQQKQRSGKEGSPHGEMVPRVGPLVTGGNRHARYIEWEGMGCLAAIAKLRECEDLANPSNSYGFTGRSNEKLFGAIRTARYEECEG